MQSSGTFGALSDGMKKAVVGKTPPPRAAAPAKPVKLAPMNTHRRGGHANHQRAK